jgi:thioredoxin-related protein
MMRLFSIILMLVFNLVAMGQLKQTPFEQIDSLNALDNKNIVVFIHTNWCKYCHKMQQTTLKNDSIQKILNEHFIFTSLNAENKQPIKFNGHTFKFIPNGYNVGYHELAVALGSVEGKLNFPTITLLNPKYEIIFQHNGFMSADALSSVMNEALKK